MTLIINGIYVGFEVLTAVVMKSSVFWDITQYNSLKVNQHFGRICRPRLQGRRIIQAINNREADRKQSMKMEACSSETSVDF
jgi:hypothetical protein